MQPDVTSRFPHEPPHRYSTKGTYIVTAGTLQKQHFFKEPSSRCLLQEILFNKAKKFQWNLKAWAVFSNHYHFIASSENEPQTLPKFINALHSVSALEINKLDHQLGRRVWYQYWDTCLTYRNSYISRLNYVMNNPVKHGIVKDARDYPWCSAAWFDKNAEKEFRKMVYGFKFDRINIVDEY